MSDLKSCGNIIPVDGVGVGKYTVTEEDGAPEEKVIILGIVEGPDRPGLVLSYQDALGMVKGVLKLLAGSGDGVADDARSMLCHKDKT